MSSRRSIRIQWKLHKLVWRLSGGRLGSRVIGLPVLELITTGNRSGQPRSILINYIDHDGSPTLIATNHGAEHNPAWVRNLRASPNATIVQDRRRQGVRARFLEGDERDRAWQKALTINPGYDEYRVKVSRPIPIVSLEAS